VSWETSEFQCSHGARKHALFCFLEKRDHLFALHAREIFKEIVDRIAAFEIINQVLNRNTRTSETRRATHDFRIDFYD